uniref:Uncharacterized protein n=1 Tax=Aureoumbra lagunensis TaxID=44058 RepID=A0A7S3K3D4_9STRA
MHNKTITEGIRRARLGVEVLRSRWISEVDWCKCEIEELRKEYFELINEREFAWGSKGTPSDEGSIKIIEQLIHRANGIELLCRLLKRAVEKGGKQQTESWLEKISDLQFAAQRIYLIAGIALSFLKGRVSVRNAPWLQARFENRQKTKIKPLIQTLLLEQNSMTTREHPIFFLLKNSDAFTVQSLVTAGTYCLCDLGMSSVPDLNIENGLALAQELCPNFVENKTYFNESKRTGIWCWLFDLALGAYAEGPTYTNLCTEALERAAAACVVENFATKQNNLYEHVFQLLAGPLCLNASRSCITALEALDASVTFKVQARLSLNQPHDALEITHSYEQQMNIQKDIHQAQVIIFKWLADRNRFAEIGSLALTKSAQVAAAQVLAYFPPERALGILLKHGAYQDAVQLFRAEQFTNARAIAALRLAQATVPKANLILGLRSDFARAYHQEINQHTLISSDFEAEFFLTTDQSPDEVLIIRQTDTAMDIDDHSASKSEEHDSEEEHVPQPMSIEEKSLHAPNNAHVIHIDDSDEEDNDQEEYLQQGADHEVEEEEADDLFGDDSEEDDEEEYEEEDDDDELFDNDNELMEEAEQEVTGNEKKEATEQEVTDNVEDEEEEEDSAAFREETPSEDDNEYHNDFDDDDHPPSFLPSGNAQSDDDDDDACQGQGTEGDEYGDALADDEHSAEMARAAMPESEGSDTDDFVCIEHRSSQRQEHDTVALTNKEEEEAPSDTYHTPREEYHRMTGTEDEDDLVCATAPSAQESTTPQQQDGDTDAMIDALEEEIIAAPASSNAEFAGDSAVEDEVILPAQQYSVHSQEKNHDDDIEIDEDADMNVPAAVTGEFDDQTLKYEDLPNDSRNQQRSVNERSIDETINQEDQAMIDVREASVSDDANLEKEFASESLEHEEDNEIMSSSKHSATVIDVQEDVSKLVVPAPATGEEFSESLSETELVPPVAQDNSIIMDGTQKSAPITEDNEVATESVEQEHVRLADVDQVDQDNCMIEDQEQPVEVPVDTHRLVVSSEQIESADQNDSIINEVQEEIVETASANAQEDVEFTPFADNTMDDNLAPHDPQEDSPVKTDDVEPIAEEPEEEDLVSEKKYAIDAIQEEEIVTQKEEENEEFEDDEEDHAEKENVDKNAAVGDELEGVDSDIQDEDQVGDLPAAEDTGRMRTRRSTRRSRRDQKTIMTAENTETVTTSPRRSTRRRGPSESSNTSTNSHSSTTSLTDIDPSNILQGRRRRRARRIVDL